MISKGDTDMRYTYRPSKTKAREFAQTMDEIDSFCHEHAISRSNSMDSYYFTVNGKRYRVSNHTVSASDKGMYDAYGVKIRESYHADDADLICITAGKTRLIEVYNNIVAGIDINKRGFAV